MDRDPHDPTVSDEEAEELRNDPELLEAVEEALAPYAGLASPETLSAMRAMMLEEMSTSPFAAGILRRLRGGTRIKSGEVMYGHEAPAASGTVRRRTGEGA